MHFARSLALASLVALPVVGMGCVPQDRYDQLLNAHRSMEEQLTRAEADRDAERANTETLRAQLSRATTNLADLQAQNSRLNADLGRIGGDYDSLLRRVSDLEIGPLPEELELAIQRLAQAYPNVLSFDSRRGLLRFASDFTFDLGSVALKPDASRTLQELAQILNTSQAAGFEVRIIGHTDNVPIGQEHTRRNHPTNMHLSVHRSISVRDALASAGVAADRMQVAGYGPHRPIVPNRPGGTAENRRVEIFLVPMPPSAFPGTAQEQPTQATAPAPRSRAAVPDEPAK